MTEPVECHHCGCLLEPDPFELEQTEDFICNECSGFDFDAFDEDLDDYCPERP